MKSSPRSRKGHIKKALNFTSKFWWMVVHYPLCSTVVDNLISWDSVALIPGMMDGYDVDFAAIIRYGIHE